MQQPVIPIYSTAVQHPPEWTPEAPLCRVELEVSRAAVHVGQLAQLCTCAAAERSGPGALTHLTNSMFLQALAGTRRVLGAAAWATCTLLGSRADSRFPLSVRVHSGEAVVLSVVRSQHSWRKVLTAHSTPGLAALQSCYACLAAVMLFA